MTRKKADTETISFFHMKSMSGVLCRCRAQMLVVFGMECALTMVPVCDALH